MNNNRIQNEGRLLIGGIFLIIFASVWIFGIYNMVWKLIIKEAYFYDWVLLKDNGIEYKYNFY